MKRCPKCGSGAERKNLAVGIAADVVGFIAGALVVPFAGNNNGNITRHTVSKGICEHAEYKCTNPRCKYEWREERSV